MNNREEVIGGKDYDWSADAWRSVESNLLEIVKLRTAEDGIGKNPNAKKKWPEYCDKFVMEIFRIIKGDKADIDKADIDKALSSAKKINEIVTAITTFQKERRKYARQIEIRSYIGTKYVYDDPAIHDLAIVKNIDNIAQSIFAFGGIIKFFETKIGDLNQLGKSIIDNMKRIGYAHPKSQEMMHAVFDILVDNEKMVNQESRVEALKETLKQDCLLSEKPLYQAINHQRSLFKDTKSNGLIRVAIAHDWLKDNKELVGEAFIKIYEDKAFDGKKVKIANAIIELSTRQDLNNDTFKKILANDKEPLTGALKQQSRFASLFWGASKTWSKVETEIIKPENPKIR